MALNVGFKVGLSSEDKEIMKNEVIEKVNKNYDEFEEEVKESIVEVKETLSGLGQLKPSGTDTEANILLFVDNKGVWVATDTGNWLYFDETQQKYVVGGKYQAVEIADGSVTLNKLDSELQDILITYEYINIELQADTVYNGVNINVGDTFSETVLTLDGCYASKVSVEEGQKYIIKGKGNAYAARTYIITDSSNIVTRITTANEINEIITIEENEKTLYVNLLNYDSSTDKFIQDKTETLRDEIKVLRDEIENTDIANGSITEEKLDTNLQEKISLISTKADITTSYNTLDLTINNGYFRNGTVDTSNTSWNYTQINVVEGEKYKVSGYGNGYVYAINYCREDLSVISTSSETGVYNPIEEEITIPNECKILIINTITAYQNLSVQKLTKETYAIAPLANKKIVNFGDSIFGNARTKNVSEFLEKYTGATVYNCGFGGCRMAKRTDDEYFDAFSMYALADAVSSGDFSLQEEKVNDTNWTSKPSYYNEALELLESINFSEVDIITISYGTNDYYSNPNNAISNESDTYDVSTICGALRYSIEKLLTAYPNLKIYILTPCWRWFMNSSYEYINDSDTYQNSNGNTLPQICQAISEVANEYHLQVIDNYNVGVNKFNREYYIPRNDGTHHNEKGRDLLARHIAKKLF